MADRDHDHPHEHGSELSETQLRVRALETILTEKGYIDPAALDAIVFPCDVCTCTVIAMHSSRARPLFAGSSRKVSW